MAAASYMGTHTSSPAVHIDERSFCDHNNIWRQLFGGRVDTVQDDKARHSDAGNGLPVVSHRFGRRNEEQSTDREVDRRACRRNKDILLDSSLQDFQNDILDKAKEVISWLGKTCRVGGFSARLAEPSSASMEDAR